jgi:ATP phosphoribosyltransferase
MNAKREDLARIEACIPGLKKPTVSSLADTDFVSIASVVEEDFFWSTIENLKKYGASGILVLPIEKMIL